MCYLAKHVTLALLTAAAATAIGVVRYAPAADLTVTANSYPVVGITQGSALVLQPVNAFPTPVWGGSSGYSPSANNGVGGYFVTANNVLLSPGGYWPVFSGVGAATNPPPYPLGSSGSFTSTGAGELGLTPPLASAAAIKFYLNPKVVYDFAQATASYAGLQYTPNSPAVPDQYNITSAGTGWLPGYPLSTPEGDTSVDAKVSSGAAGVFWNTPTDVAAGAADNTYTDVNISTGAIDATNSGSAAIVGRSRLLWGASGTLSRGSFVEFGLQSTVTAGLLVTPASGGAGPIVFSLVLPIGGPPTGLLATGTGTDQISLNIAGTGSGSSHQSFADGSYVGEGYSVSLLPSGGYGYSFWAVSLSPTLALDSGSDFAGTATATMLAHYNANLSLDPSQLPASYSADQPGFGLAVPEPSPLCMGLLGAVAALGWPRRRCHVRRK